MWSIALCVIDSYPIETTLKEDWKLYSKLLRVKCIYKIINETLLRRLKEHEIYEEADKIH